MAGYSDGEAKVLTQLKAIGTGTTWTTTNTARGSWVISLIFVMTRYSYPDFFDNERYYSLNPMKILDPKILEFDYLMNNYYFYFIYFDFITLPLYRIFGEFYAILILRIIIWIFQIWALSELMRRMGMEWWGFIILFVIWINVEDIGRWRLDFPKR